MLKSDKKEFTESRGGARKLSGGGILETPSTREQLVEKPEKVEQNYDRYRRKGGPSSHQNRDNHSISVDGRRADSTGSLESSSRKPPPIKIIKRVGSDSMGRKIGSAASAKSEKGGVRTTR